MADDGDDGDPSAGHRYQPVGGHRADVFALAVVSVLVGGFAFGLTLLLTS